MEKKASNLSTLSRLGASVNRVVAIAVLLSYAYAEIGKMKWSLAIAQLLPVSVKYGSLFCLLASVMYTDWRILGHAVNETKAALRNGWLIWDALLAITFAIATADRRELFHLGNVAMFAILAGSERLHLFRSKERRDGNGKRDAVRQSRILVLWRWIIIFFASIGALALLRTEFQKLGIIQH